jgi:hypothetical protein
VRGVAFQPVFASGRHSTLNTQQPTPLNTADIILAAVAQSGGRLRFEDFTPLPCGDPNCATIGYLLKVDGGTRSISEFIDFGKVQGFLRDKVRYRLEDLLQCGCESEPLGALLKQFEIMSRIPFACSSSRSWTQRPGTKTASTAAARMSSGRMGSWIHFAAITHRNGNGVRIFLAPARRHRRDANLLGASRPQRFSADDHLSRCAGRRVRWREDCLSRSGRLDVLELAKSLADLGDGQDDPWRLAWRLCGGGDCEVVARLLASDG